MINYSKSQLEPVWNVELIQIGLRPPSRAAHCENLEKYGSGLRSVNSQTRTASHFFALQAGPGSVKAHPWRQRRAGVSHLRPGAGSLFQVI